MNTGAFGENFPYSNFHDLNMDWIIKIAKDFLDQYTHIQETIDQGLEDLDAKANALEALLQEWYDTHSKDIANQLAEALADLENWYTTHEGYLDKYVTDSITAFNQAAENKAQQTIATIPDDYTSLFNAFVRENENVFRLNSITNWQRNKSCATNDATVGPIIDNNSADCAIIEVTAGDQLYITGNGGADARLWAFADNSDNILLRSDASTIGNILKPITVPTGATKLIINILHKSQNPYAFVQKNGSRYVRDYGFILPTDLIISDVNLITTSSFFTFASSITATQVAHLPKYGVAGCIITFYNQLHNMIHQIVFYSDGALFTRFNLGAWSEYPDANLTVKAMGLLNDYAQYQNDSINIYQAGVYFIGNISATDLAGLPVYNRPAILVVSTAGYNINRGVGSVQNIYYIGDKAYSRIVYGDPNDLNATEWLSQSASSGGGYIVVKADGTGDYTSIVSAINTASNGDTIVVFPGVYNGTLRLFKKTVNIIGVDKNTCIIRSTDGRYTNPAMEATTGHFENLTFMAEYVQGESNEITENDTGAYAVHIEGSLDEGFAIGKQMSFTNCRFISDFFPAVGCGASANWSIEFDNCELITNQPSGRGEYISNGTLGALFFHDQAGTTKGSANAVFKNCIFRNTQFANTMCLYDLNTEGNSVNFTFINNTCYSNIRQFTNSIWWRGITTAFTNHLHLDGISNGNTESELNSAT